MASLMFKLVSKIHVWMFRSSGGRRGSRMAGQDVVLLTTKGRKTGAPRTVPVMSFEDGGNRIVIASKGGAPANPAWFLNLEADPNVTVEAGPEKYQARAEVVGPDERPRLWEKVVAAAPQFGGYEKKTSRLIPVVRLVRAS